MYPLVTVTTTAGPVDTYADATVSLGLTGDLTVTDTTAHAYPVGTWTQLALAGSVA